MSTQDDETLKLYVEESREHLADIENDLLAIEEAGAEIDEDLVNKVFRAAHSIKGGAGFMELNNIKELAHKAENVLGMIRNREMIPNPEIINILLLSFDKLRELINNVDQSNEIDISEHVVALTGLTTSSLPQEEKESVSKMVDIRLPNGKVVFSISEFDISQARKGGKFIYLIEYDLIHDVHNKGKNPFEVLTAVEKSGMILESKVDVDSVGTLDEETIPNRLPFLILFATILEPDIIGTLCEVDEKYIHEIKEDTTSPQISASTQTQTAAAPEPPSSQKPEVSSEIVAPPSDKKEKIKPKTEREIKPSQRDTSLRVNVSLLDSLMTLAGELVLSRNQLLQTLITSDRHASDIAGQRIDMITSELQEAIMRTRMQAIGNVFSKFTRVVRDLARDLGKEVSLTLDGNEVELDKTIIEGLSDPLTHLVRNAVDHGIEAPDVRRKAGKEPVGQVFLKAYHEAGQVNIEIKDDGKGLDGNKLAAAATSKGLISEEQARTMSEKEKTSLILLPGFSTAEKVTDVSGRGVGMDVVKSNLDKLGGVVDIDTELGKGTDIRIKLPLTLAIIPSQILSTEGERYAIPQVNLDELLRIPAARVKDRIEVVGDAEVVRLRGKLLPIVSLADVLGVERTYLTPGNGGSENDRREEIADRRSKRSPLFEDDSPEGEKLTTHNSQPAISDHSDRRLNPDRRYHASSAVNIAVVSAGAFKYGLVVDALQDSEEIVVKPLGRHLKNCEGYAGATIMGDGRVALILDVANLARMAKLTSLEGTDRAAEVAREDMEFKKDAQVLLLFRSAEDEQFAVPLNLVERIEKIKTADVEEVGGKKVIQNRGRSLPLFSVDEVANVKSLAQKEKLLGIVFTVAGKEVGLLATGPVDAKEVAIEIDDKTLKQPGIMGSAIIDNTTTLIVDMFSLIQTLQPDWFGQQEIVQVSDDEEVTILLAEDSNFFRNQVRDFIEGQGYKVIEAEDGMVAWNLLQEHANEISLVVTDIEMPNLDGLGLTKKIKGDERFSHLPVIAVTTLAADEDIAKGKAVGVDDYQIKLNREKLMESICNYLKERGH